MDDRIDSSCRERAEPRLATRWTRIQAMHDQDAERNWQWFVERYRPFVRGILLAGLGGSGAAGQAEAEFWGYVWLSGALKRADRGRRFRPFLAGIARNFARVFARTHALPCTDENTSPERIEARNTDDLRMWTENVIANALTALREEHPTAAQAVTSFYGLATDAASGVEQSAASIAAQLGNSLPGVYMLLLRGRKRLRELIEAELRDGCEDEDSWHDELRQFLGVTATKVPGLLVTEAATARIATP